MAYLADTLEGFLEPEIAQSLREIMDSVKATKASDFEIVFDATLVRGMSYYTGTIFEIAMPEFGGSCGGGGRYDKMVGKFTGNDVPACGFPSVSSVSSCCSWREDSKFLRDRSR